jgi:hypothetical protein
MSGATNLPAGRQQLVQAQQRALESRLPCAGPDSSGPEHSRNCQPSDSLHGWEEFPRDEYLPVECLIKDDAARPFHMGCCCVKPVVRGKLQRT